MQNLQQILVIKHGALGDIILASGAFRAIRTAYPHAHIVALTSPAYASLLARSPYFNEIWSDRKPKLRDRMGLHALRLMLNSRRWDFVFDLQTSGRSTRYQWLFRRPWPRISNISRWSSHGWRDPQRMQKHALERLRQQLQVAGIDVGPPDIDWLAEAVDALHPPSSYALLVPGGAAHRPEKRWPAEQYAALAHELVQRGVTPLLIGTAAEESVLQSIAAREPKALNYSGKTSIAQLATLARGAHYAIGNDTGPMHVIAATGCPCAVLFSHASNPDQSAPPGANVTIFHAPDLSALSVDRVLSAVLPHLPV